MTAARKRTSVGEWDDASVEPGQSRDLMLAVGESYSSLTVEIPVHVRRAPEDGPVVFVTAALHGDEINGTGAVRELVQDEDFRPVRGSLILVPVLNILAFDRHSRYLPDRRDLNRSFPGMTKGSLASRMARRLFDEIVTRSDYGIDLHTASVRRTNFPSVRADVTDPEVKRIAEAFGCEVIGNSTGPKGSFRREACLAGCPTIVMEGGEVWKVEPGIVETTVRGIKNILRELDMLDGEIEHPGHQVTVDKTKWLRAEKGGFLQFHAGPGEFVAKDQPLATNTTLLGREQSMILAPFDAVILGMTTLPAVSPGEPVCNLAQLPKGTSPEDFRDSRSSKDDLAERVAEDLGANLLVTDPND